MWQSLYDRLGGDRESALDHFGVPEREKEGVPAAIVARRDEVVRPVETLLASYRRRGVAPSFVVYEPVEVVSAAAVEREPGCSPGESKMI